MWIFHSNNDHNQKQINKQITHKVLFALAFGIYGILSSSRQSQMFFIFPWTAIL